MNYKRTIFITIVLLASLYSAKVYTGGTVNNNGQLRTEKAIQGKLIWQQYNCASCHQIYGLGGYMGPDLTNEITLKGKDFARAFIVGGSLKMPDLHLNKEQVDNLIEYLVCLNRSGEYPVKNPNLTFWGNIDITQADRP